MPNASFSKLSALPSSPSAPDQGAGVRAEYWIGQILLATNRLDRPFFWIEPAGAAIKDLPVVQKMEKLWDECCGADWPSKPLSEFDFATSQPVPQSINRLFLAGVVDVLGIRSAVNHRWQRPARQSKKSAGRSVAERSLLPKWNRGYGILPISKELMIELLL